MRGSDEASHVKSILESVCQSEEIGREAINKLCRHVKADPQEEQVGGIVQEFTWVSFVPNAKMAILCKCTGLFINRIFIEDSISHCVPMTCSDMMLTEQS